MGLEDFPDYHTAAALCETRGAHLAVPRTDAEMTCVRQEADKLSKLQVWLGVNDEEVEGEFRGIDGCGVVAVRPEWWDSPQPNGGTTENRVASTPSGWYDSGPTNIKHPLCQLANCYKPHCP